jgi:glutamine amidotransferase
MNIGVVDYGAGNLRSVETALRYLSARFSVVRDAQSIAGYDALIIPGVGDAKAAMGRLDRAGLSQAIREFHRSGRWVLGICLGTQIVLEGSEEGDAECLGLIPGKAQRFSRDLGLKVPHMGWNTINFEQHHEFLRGVPHGASVYFVHSYYPAPNRKNHVLTVTQYGIQFPSSIVNDNLVAFQFHPEKSGRHGLKILENFIAAP